MGLGEGSAKLRVVDGVIGRGCSRILVATVLLLGLWITVLIELKNGLYEGLWLRTLCSLVHRNFHLHLSFFDHTQHASQQLVGSMKAITVALLCCILGSAFAVPSWYARSFAFQNRVKQLEAERTGMTCPIL